MGLGQGFLEPVQPFGFGIGPPSLLGGRYCYLLYRWGNRHREVKQLVHLSLPECGRARIRTRVCLALEPKLIASTSTPTPHPSWPGCLGSSLCAPGESHLLELQCPSLKVKQ